MHFEPPSERSFGFSSRHVGFGNKRKLGQVTKTAGVVGVVHFSLKLRFCWSKMAKTQIHPGSPYERLSDPLLGVLPWKYGELKTVKTNVICWQFYHGNMGIIDRHKTNVTSTLTKSQQGQITHWTNQKSAQIQIIGAKCEKMQTSHSWCLVLLLINWGGGARFFLSNHIVKLSKTKTNTNNVWRSIEHWSENL